MVDEVKNFILQPAHFRLDGGAMYGIIPKPLWQKVSPPDDQNRIDLSCRLWLLKGENKTALIDTGIGDYHDAKFVKRFDVRCQPSALEKCLENISLTTDDVSDVVISHLHFDHVGGLGMSEKENHFPIFPKATLHLHKSHYEYALNPTERDSGSFHTKVFNPLIDHYKSNNQINWLEGSEGKIIDELDLSFKCSNGHTPWLMHPYTNKFIYLADLIPTSNHVHIPWVMGYDISPGITTKDKREFLSFVKEKNLKIIYEHDPVYWGSEIHLDEKNNFAVKEKSLCEKTSAYSI